MYFLLHIKQMKNKKKENYVNRTFEFGDIYIYIYILKKFFLNKN